MHDGYHGGVLSYIPLNVFYQHLHTLTDLSFAALPIVADCYRSS